METTKIMAYVEKNADAPPVGLYGNETNALTINGRVLARVASGKVELCEGVRVSKGGLVMLGDGRLTSHPSATTTAIVVDNVDLTEARELSLRYQGWVILPKGVA